MMASKPNTQRKDQTARVHGGQSNRRTKDRGESKPVFKSVLANPFEVKWPTVPSDVQNAILSRVVELMHGIAEYNLSRHKHSRSTRVERRARKRANASKQDAQEQEAIVAAAIEQSNQDKNFNNNGNNAVTAMPADIEASIDAAPEAEPEILQHTIIGINAVTKRLEAQCSTSRHTVSAAAETDANTTPHARDDSNFDGDATTATDALDNDTGARQSENTDTSRRVGVIRSEDGDEADAEMMDDAGTSPTSASPTKVINDINNNANANADTTRHAPISPIRTVLVCRADIDPPLLVAHIPHLVAACNSATMKDPNAKGVKLVSLPKGAESSLAMALGLRRISVLAFDETLASDPGLSSLLSSIPTITAPWLTGFLNFPEESSQPHSPSASITRTITNARITKTNPPKPAEAVAAVSHAIGSERLCLEPTHIKQLRTTAPKDMRTAKALRAKGRAEAKAQRKAILEAAAAAAVKKAKKTKLKIKLAARSKRTTYRTSSVLLQ